MAEGASTEQINGYRYHVHSRNLFVEHGKVAQILGEPFEIFSKFVRVFDLFFVATEKSADEKVLHGACVLYQYIDNDDDGVPDNQEVYRKLVEMKATMVMFKNERELDRNEDFFEDIDDYDVEVQDLQADETNPEDEFDASIEECFHLLTQGYARAYPDVFGLKPGTHVANCCDTARGGYFKNVPKQYPAEAWFTYYDETCDHEGQIVEYLYWAMTSILGAQENREEIRNEWRLHTSELVRQHDPVVFALLTNEFYSFPKHLPASYLSRKNSTKRQSKDEPILPRGNFQNSEITVAATAEALATGATSHSCYHSNSRNLVVEHGNVAQILGEPFEIFSKFVRVFDLFFVATEKSADQKVLHGACVLYQYIDNDDDGVPDNQEVYRKLVEIKATMVMFKNERELDRNEDFFEDIDDYDVEVQDLQADETNPEDEFDASIEECFHLLTQGYARAYPDVFGLKPGTHVANCCDTARGGYFKKVPKKYPEEAWFTYYDKTCKHEGQIVEYLYWAMTSILRAQEHRSDDICDEWHLHTPELVSERDPEIYALLTDSFYKLPTKIPITHLSRYPSSERQDNRYPSSENHANSSLGNSSNGNSIAQRVYSFFFGN